MARRVFPFLSQGHSGCGLQSRSMARRVFPFLSQGHSGCGLQSRSMARLCFGLQYWQAGGMLVSKAAIWGLMAVPTVWKNL
jgi:hypothetical protein